MDEDEGGYKTRSYEQVWSGRQTAPPPPQSLLVRHSTQDMVAVSQKSAPPRPQSLLFMQPSTQRWPGPQARWFVHCVLLRHSTHCLPATSQCSPFGQFASCLLYTSPSP